MIHGTMTTSSKKDYLSILGLSPDFDDNELKKAFRREARKWHPDLNKNDLNAEERFKLINEAYEFLRDPKKRNPDLEKNKNFNDDVQYKTGFPDFQEYLNSLFGYEHETQSYRENDIEEEYIHSDNDHFNSYGYPLSLIHI